MPFKRAALDAYKGVLAGDFTGWSPTWTLRHPFRAAAIRIDYRRDRSDDPFIVHAAGRGVVGPRLGLLILIILLIFIAQNTESITVHFLVFDWSLPVGVGYLLSAVAGATTTAM